MIITPSTLQASTPRLAELLDTYTPNPQPADDRTVLRLTNPDGYTIGARTRVDGTTLQLWITAPGAKPLEPPSGLQPLRPGHSYHTVLQLAGMDGDLGDTIHAALADRLLPAITMKPRYIGHRPWEPEPTVEPEEPGTDVPAVEGDTTAPAADAKPARTRAAKKTATAPAKPRSRNTATATA